MKKNKNTNKERDILRDIINSLISHEMILAKRVEVEKYFLTNLRKRIKALIKKMEKLNGK